MNSHQRRKASRKRFRDISKRAQRFMEKYSVVFEDLARAEEAEKVWGSVPAELFKNTVSE